MPPIVTFISKANAFQLTLEPQLPQTSPTGNTSFTKGKRIQFYRGVYQATPEEAVRLGYPSVDALAAAVRSASTLNREFFEKGNEPGAMHPPTQDLLDRILTAAMRGQADKIKEILALERDTHQREEVLKQGELALGELTEGREGRRAPGRRPGQPQAA